MSMSIKKRLALGAGALATVGAVGTLAAGVTFGLFSASQGPTSSGTFTALTVAEGTPGHATCVNHSIVPGDSTAGWNTKNGAPTGQTDSPFATCTITVANTSTTPTDVGIVLANTGTLYDASATGLQYLVQADGNVIDNGSLSQTGAAGNDLYIASDPATGGSHSITMDWYLPTGSVNAYQGLTAALSVTVDAVQSGNNAPTNPCTVGQECAGIVWS